MDGKAGRIRRTGGVGIREGLVECEFAIKFMD
jgi:hypothetical protein